MKTFYKILLYISGCCVLATIAATLANWWRRKALKEDEQEALNPDRTEAMPVGDINN